MAVTTLRSCRRQYDTGNCIIRVFREIRSVNVCVPFYVGVFLLSIDTQIYSAVKQVCELERSSFIVWPPLFIVQTENQSSGVRGNKNIFHRKGDVVVAG